MPCLIVLGARIRLRSTGGTREMALEDFYLDYQKTALGPDEFVERIKRPAAHFGVAHALVVAEHVAERAEQNGVDVGVDRRRDQRAQEVHACGSGERAGD